MFEWETESMHSSIPTSEPQLAPGQIASISVNLKKGIMASKYEVHEDILLGSYKVIVRYPYEVFLLKQYLKKK